MSSWTKNQEEYLKNNYSDEDFEVLKKELGKSRRAISTKASRMGLSRVENWSEEEVKYLKDNYEDTRNEELANELSRSKSSIYNKAYKIGLKSDRTLIRRGDIIDSKLEAEKLTQYEIGFLCGLICGEGSFTIRKERNDKKSFSIDIMMKEENILKKVKEILGCGSVYENSGGMYSYSLNDAEYIWNKVIPLFEEANFMNAKKKSQYKIWKMELIEYYNLPTDSNENG